MNQPFGLFRSLLLSSGLAGGLGFVTRTLAVTVAPVLATCEWVSQCSDCTSFGNPGNNFISARLTLVNYTRGDEIDLGNFASFHYLGSNRVDPYSVSVGVPPGAGSGMVSADSAQAAGSIQSVPAPNRFELVFDDGLHFQTQVHGTWSTCAPGPCSYCGGSECGMFNFQVHSAIGTGATFFATPVPEPGVRAMLFAGLGVLALARRRRTS